MTLLQNFFPKKYMFIFNNLHHVLYWVINHCSSSAASAEWWLATLQKLVLLYLRELFFSWCCQNEFQKNSPTIQHTELWPNHMYIQTNTQGFGYSKWDYVFKEKARFLFTLNYSPRQLAFSKAFLRNWWAI